MFLLIEFNLTSQALERLARREFDDVPVRIAHHREVADDAADIDRRLDQNVLLAGKFRNAIDFSPRVALKSEVVEAGFHFVLNYDKDKNRIFSGRRLWSQPDIVPPFRPSIADNRKTAE